MAWIRPEPQQPKRSMPPWQRPLGTRAPLLVYRLTRRAQEWLYQWVADNRYRLPSATLWWERYPSRLYREVLFDADGFKRWPLIAGGTLPWR